MVLSAAQVWHGGQQFDRFARLSMQSAC